MDYKKLYSDLIVELFIFLDNDSYIKIRDFIIKQGEQESNKQTKMNNTIEPVRTFIDQDGCWYIEFKKEELKELLKQYKNTRNKRK